MSPDHLLYFLVCKEGQRPLLPDDPDIETRGLVDAVWSLMTRCWAQKPQERCTAENVSKELADIILSSSQSPPRAEVGTGHLLQLEDSLNKKVF